MCIPGTQNGVYSRSPTTRLSDSFRENVPALPVKRGFPVRNKTGTRPGHLHHRRVGILFRCPLASLHSTPSCTHAPSSPPPKKHGLFPSSSIPAPESKRSLHSRIFLPSPSTLGCSASKFPAVPVVRFPPPRFTVPWFFPGSEPRNRPH